MKLVVAQVAMEEKKLHEIDDAVQVQDEPNVGQSTALP